MKLCFSTLACPDWDLPRIFDAGVAAGVSGIDFRGIGSEIDITRLPAFKEGLPETLRDMRTRELQMPCLNTSITLVTPAPERWQMMLDECQRYAHLAKGCGTGLLRVFGGNVPKEMVREEARSLAARHLRQLVKIVGTGKLTILLETHDAWSTSAEVLELLQETSPADVGVLWDIEHPYRRGERPGDTIAALGKYLRHVHVKDSVQQDGKNLPRLLGEGDLPIAECFFALHDAGYTGWFCLETEKRWHPQEAPAPEVSIPQFATFMRELRRQTPRLNQR